MRHEDVLQTLADTISAATFPVYGIANHLLDLSLSSNGAGISHLGHFMSVTLVFTSPRYGLHRPYSAKSQNVQLTSLDAIVQRPERENMFFALDELSEEQYFDSETGVFRHYHFSEEEQKQVGSAVIREEKFSIADINFFGKVSYWHAPLKISKFLLRSEDTVLIGETYGLPFDELIQVLEGLQVVNHRDDLLKQYQDDLLAQTQRQLENPNM